MTCPLVALPFGYAAEPTELAEEAVSISTFYTSEYEMYEALTATPADKLLEAGYSADVVRSIKSTCYETLLRERASLDVGTLSDYGYPQEQISLLKALDHGNISYNTNLAAATSSGCFGDAHYISISAKRVVFYYTWEWSSMPLVHGTDSAAVAWEDQGATGDVDVLLQSTTAQGEYWLGLKKEKSPTPCMLIPQKIRISPI